MKIRSVFPNLLGFLALFVSAAVCSGQVTTVTGVVSDSQSHALASGQVVFSLTNCGGNPSVGSSSYTFHLDSGGNISGTVEPNSLNGCVGNASYFTVTASSSTGVLQWKRLFTVPTPGPWNLGTATPLTNIPSPVGGGASGASTPATSALLKGNGSVNGVVAATPGTDYVVPSGNISGTSSNLSGTPALPSGVTATTQTQGDNTSKLATDAFVATAVAGLVGGGASTPATTALLKGNGLANGVTTAAAGTDYVAPTLTINGHALSSNVTISATDLSTGTLPHGQLPALVSGDIPNNAANTSGTAANLSGTPTLPNGTKASTQTAGDNTTNLATTAFVATAVSGIAGGGASTPATSALLKGNGSANGVVAATPGTDYDAGGAATTAQTNSEAAFTGDVTKTANSFNTTVTRINGTSLAGLSTGILKNTTTTGVPSIAVAGTDYQAPLGFTAVPNTLTINSHALTSNVTISATDLSTGTLPHGQLPTLVSGDIPNNAANTSGTSANLSGTPALPNGVTATTQSSVDNTAKLATDAFVQAVVGSVGNLPTLPTVGSVPYSLTSQPSGGVGGAAAWGLAGITGRTVTITSDTVAATDRGSSVIYNDASAVASSLTSPSTLGNNFDFVTHNIGAGVVTITAGGGNINGSGSSLALSQGDSCALSSPDNLNNDARCSPGLLTAGAGITITPSANGKTITATGSGGTSTPATSALLKGNGSANGVVAATAGTDYVVPSGNITGTASNVSGTPALPNGVTGTTQSSVDNTTKLATDAFVQSVVSGISGNLVNTTITVTTTAIPANSCTSASTFTMTGLATTSTIALTPASDISSTTGWSAGAGGQLYFTAWPSATNTGSYKVCNPTTASITPGASTTWNVSGVTSGVAGLTNVQFTVGTSAIAANTCATAATATITGLATTSTISITPASDISSTTGWSAGTAGALYFTAWPTTNTLNYRVCNPTTSSITPGASTTWNGSGK